MISTEVTTGPLPAIIIQTLWEFYGESPLPARLVEDNDEIGLMEAPSFYGVQSDIGLIKHGDRWDPEF
jgi:hypothetical protein